MTLQTHLSLYSSATNTIQCRSFLRNAVRTWQGAHDVCEKEKTVIRVFPPQVYNSSGAGLVVSPPHAHIQGHIHVHVEVELLSVVRKEKDCTINLV